MTDTDDTDERGPKERAYDDAISPLMTQIIALCKAHKINAAATFILDPREDDDGDPVCCTTVLPVDSDDAKGYERVMACKRVMYPSAQIIAFTIHGASK